jgi:predicted permease
VLHALKSGLRSVVLHPGLSLLVVLIIALCIGGNTAVFSAAKVILFQDLPYKDIDRLVVLDSYHRTTSIGNDISWLEIGDWRRQSRLFQDVTPLAYYQDRLLFDEGIVQRIGVNYVGTSYFNLLGVQPQAGRFFSSAESQPGGAPAVVLSDELWQRLAGRDPAILGKTVQLNSSQFTVIGVAPAGFQDFVEGLFEIDAWLPAATAAEAFVPDLFESRNARYWIGLARLKPGVTAEQAQQEGEAVYAGLRSAFPESNKEYEARVTPFREFIFRDLYQRVQVLLVGVVVVLLIGCANVANLLLVRLAERRRELSLRLALGANRVDLARQVLAESLVLAVLGGVLGVLLAVWAVQALSGLIVLPPFVEIHLDGRVLAVSAAATLITGLLFGLPSALSVARMETTGTLQEVKAAGGRTHTSRGRSSLLVFQVAVVMTLLIVAGLLLRSFLRLRGTGLGIASDRLLTLPLSFEAERFLSDRQLISQAEQELLQKMRGVAGVEGAAVWGPGMPGIGHPFTDVGGEGAAAGQPSVRVDMHSINPGALRLLGVPLLRGRDLTPQDTREVPRVALVSQSLAGALWPGEDPLGKRLRRTDRENDPWATVVGVIDDIRLQGRFSDGTHHLVFSHLQLPTREANLLVRTSVSAASMTETVRQLVQEVDPQIPIYDVATLDERLREQEIGHRLNAAVVTSYSLLALVLAVLGLYGLLAYTVVQRTKEIGVRMALGARRKTLLRMVMGHGLGLVALGIVLGLLSALAVTRLLANQLFGVSAQDSLTFIGITVTFTVITLLATYLPARRVLKVEPTVAMRFE